MTQDKAPIDFSSQEKLVHNESNIKNSVILQFSTSPLLPSAECRNQFAGVERGPKKCAKVPRCSHEGCFNQVQQGGVCTRHGAKLRRCSLEGCTSKAVQGGVCIRHGAKVPRCSQEGCSNKVVQGGVCVRHGAKLKRCSHRGCTNKSVRAGVCIRHGSHVGCANVTKEGRSVCVEHCEDEGCTQRARRRGVCYNHCADKTLASSIGQREAVTSLQSIKGCKATAERTINAAVGKINAHNRQANAGHAVAVRYSKSLPLSPMFPNPLSAMVPNFSDDDKIGEWVYKYIPPEHQHMSARHFSELLLNARENRLVTDGSKGLLITNNMNKINDN
ncbi:hypothetical protein ACHAXA_007703 [Cyclostephanos tholiformis]|uniref:WRKY19-like zinc finger domain-containing protein n=1 Tax=Cyclostephanos tholiformis TaxID=382380 RepID=A0ABD3RBG7_9STRA